MKAIYAVMTFLNKNGPNAAHVKVGNEGEIMWKPPTLFVWDEGLVLGGNVGTQYQP